MVFPMRTIVLVDGQNLFHLAKAAWGPRHPYHWPSYDVEKLAQALTNLKPDRTLEEVRFYTGVPDPGSDRRWYDFWRNKLRHLENQGIHVYRGSESSAGQ